MFEDFIKRPGAEKAYNAFYKFATDDNSPPFLGCYGSTGCGKSHLLEAAAFELNRRGIYCKVIPAYLMYQALKNSMTQGAIPSYSEILMNYCKAPVLLLDDIGAGMKDSEWADSILEEIVLYRFDRELKTAFVSNKNFNELPERVVSRFLDKVLSVLVLNEATDYRKLKGITNAIP